MVIQNFFFSSFQFTVSSRRDSICPFLLNHSFWGVMKSVAILDGNELILGRDEKCSNFGRQ